MTTATQLPKAQYLTFFVADAAYAIEVLRVREVIEPAPITRVPSTPRAVRGVINLRGSVVPVVDLGIRFEQTERPLTKWTCIVLVEVAVDGESDKAVMGILVDAVDRVVELGEDQIEAVPQFGTHVRLDFLRGMGVLGDKFVLLLDVDSVLSTPDLLAVAALGAQPRAEAS
jgi:purine-binding chemotaxis protein CheW